MSARRSATEPENRGVVGAVLRWLGMLAAAGFIALLVYGVTSRAPDRTIDDALARTEAVDAARAYALAVREGREQPEEATWEKFARYLYTADMPDPDLLIRTSGELRISNFLLLQLAYAEMVFTPTLWPDFGKAELQAAVEEYAKRERRYGLTTEQIKAGPR